MSDQEVSTDDQAAQAEPAQEKVSEASARLVKARKSLGLSQKEVADKLFLTTTFIRYIDDGEFDRIPKPAFVKGYLRSYARTVELSGDEIVALYEAELQAAEPAPEIKGVTEEKVGTASITGPVLQTGVVGLIGLSLIVAVIWGFVSEPEKEPTRPVVTQSSLPGPSPRDRDEREPSSQEAFGYIEASDEAVDATDLIDDAAESANPVVQEFIEDAASDAESEAQTESEAVEEAVSDEAEVPPVALNAEPDDESESPEPEAAAADSTNDAAESDEITIERLVEGDRRYITVNAGGFEQLELSFGDDCWVEIDDDLHDKVYNDLNRGGDVLTVYATLPIRVLLGKATDVEMIYNGRPFDLEPFISQDNTAKITISQ